MSSSIKTKNKCIFTYKSFELRLQTKDKKTALDWVATGFGVKVYDGKDFIGVLKDDGDVLPAPFKNIACLGEV